MLLKGNEFKEITQQAKKQGWGIGAFNAFDLESASIILDAGEETNTPIIIQLIDFVDPELNFVQMPYSKLKSLYQYIIDRARDSKNPVAIHLDHCNTIDGCMRAIQFGATSVMLDASMKSYEENVELTKQVKKICDATNVALEAEIGHVSGHEYSPGSIYTDLQTAIDFYNDTNVDLLAVSIGTIHGEYKDKTALNYERIKEINEAIPAALCMHGSSGLEAEQFIKAIDNGIVKINFSTYLHKVVADAMRQGLEEGLKSGWALTRKGHEAGLNYLKEHIKIFKTMSI